MYSSCIISPQSDFFLNFALGSSRSLELGTRTWNNIPISTRDDSSSQRNEEWRTKNANSCPQCWTQWSNTLTGHVTTHVTFPADALYGIDINYSTASSDSIWCITSTVLPSYCVSCAAWRSSGAFSLQNNREQHPQQHLTIAKGNQSKWCQTVASAEVV